MKMEESKKKMDLKKLENYLRNKDHEQVVSVCAGYMHLLYEILKKVEDEPNLPFEYRLLIKIHESMADILE
jgi:hypothetical protein